VTCRPAQRRALGKRRWDAACARATRKRLMIGTNECITT
jgi:hypothetical protein